MPHQAGPLQRASARLQREAHARLTRLETANPGWRPLLAVVRETIAALQSREPAVWWDLRPGAGVAAPGSGAPLLHQASIALDLGLAQRVLRRLASAAGLERRRLEGHQVRTLLHAVVTENAAIANHLAQELELPASALLTVARHAIIPLLGGCAAQLAGVARPAGPLGFCPVCGAWPILAELRGLEQARRLRCGRCAADWAGEWLCCNFCGERDHRRMGTLVPQAGASTRVETCASCNGYLKTLTTLVPLSAAELLLGDLETVELDLAARDDGFGRPSGLAFPLELELTAAPGSSPGYSGR